MGRKIAATTSGSAYSIGERAPAGGAQDVVVTRITQPRITWSTSAASVSEATSSVPLTVTLNVPLATEVFVTLTTSDKPATVGSDYVDPSATLRFAPGQTSITRNVAITNDTQPETTEWFTLWLSNPSSNARLGAQRRVTVAIRDNDTVAQPTPTPGPPGQQALRCLGTGDPTHQRPQAFGTRIVWTERLGP